MPTHSDSVLVHSDSGNQESPSLSPVHFVTSPYFILTWSQQVSTWKNANLYQTDSLGLHLTCLSRVLNYLRQNIEHKKIIMVFNLSLSRFQNCYTVFPLQLQFHSESLHLGWSPSCQSFHNYGLLVHRLVGGKRSSQLVFLANSFISQQMNRGSLFVIWAFRSSAVTF